VFPKPAPQLLPNTYAFETTPMVKPTGFREYDARWLFGKEINLMGVQALGLALARCCARWASGPNSSRDTTSAPIRLDQARADHGPDGGGGKVHDIGLALSPMAYFAPVRARRSAVAMVTASHNDNGWTGVKMGAARPVTFGPDEMAASRRSSFPANLNMPTAAPTGSSRISRPATPPTSPTGRS